jgi:hypothetical protein
MVEARLGNPANEPFGRRTSTFFLHTQ